MKTANRTYNSRWNRVCGGLPLPSLPSGLCLWKPITCQRYRYKHWVDEVERAKNRTKAKVRAKVERVFGVIKLKFGFVKVRYRGMAKNATGCSRPSRWRTCM